MNTLDTFYVPRPQEGESEGEKYLAFRLREEWVAVDGDKLLLPVTLTERNGQTLDPEREGLLSQYGGHQLLTQLLLDLDDKPRVGDEFILQYDEMSGFRIDAVPAAPAAADD